MVGRPIATRAARGAVSALLVACGLLTTVGSGCSQLLGIAAITADDGGTNDIIGDGSVADAGSTDVTGSDGATKDSVGDGSVSDSGPECSGDLSNVGAGDFLISFRLQTNQTDRIVALLNQRYVCDQTIFWDVQLVSLQIYFELSESSGEGGYSFVNSSSPPLNDNRPHDVVITRKTSMLQILVDGKLVGARPVIQHLGILAPLKVGDDVCVGGDGTAKLQGAISNICIRPN